MILLTQSFIIVALLADALPQLYGTTGGYGAVPTYGVPTGGYGVPTVGGYGVPIAAPAVPVYAPPQPVYVPTTVYRAPVYSGPSYGRIPKMKSTLQADLIYLG